MAVYSTLLLTACLNEYGYLLNDDWRNELIGRTVPNRGCKRKHANRILGAWENYDEERMF